MSEGIRPTRAKYDALAEATKQWSQTALPKLPPDYDKIAERVNSHQVLEREQAEMMAKMAGLKRNTESRQAAYDAMDSHLNHDLSPVDERDKSPIEAALDNLQYATRLLESCIGELSRRLEPVSLPCTPIVGNKQKPASSPMEEVILDRRDEVIAVHDRIRGIIERLQL